MNQLNKPTAHADGGVHINDLPEEKVIEMMNKALEAPDVPVTPMLRMKHISHLDLDGYGATILSETLQKFYPEGAMTLETLNILPNRLDSELEATLNMIDDYDLIFLGFPIWWYVAPTIINTFLEKYDFSGKKIILFATSGGSKFGKTVEELKVSVSADTEIIEGKLLNGRQSIASIKAWTDTMNI